ncbi:glycerophosphoryl diester phosphodiesterase [Leifsonia sp. LS1]|uniref:glycerophosphodiester phosphodiesterase n=1 Tax=Leifsonia sp. LS1 TaxID=2828483 RepID=UPI001CFF29CD|nr:glycerophosphodiester phosphodiesterase [Leifsonia sp. LS1]GIT82060.1 glycerophosphoryl diester phosphodiesterase [Leifsonia sp. LS1]
MTTSRSFVFCGHRGNMAEAPENTLLGFASAERVGVDEIEFDVRVTSDGVLVIVHDHTLARTAAEWSPYLHTPIEELTFEQVRSVDLGQGQRVPTFEETLEATTVLLQVEIKALSAARPLAKFLRSRPSSDLQRSLFTSFDALSLADFADEWGDTAIGRGIGFHTHDVTSNWREAAKRLGATMVLIPLDMLDRQLVDELHEEGYLVAGSLLENHGDVRRILELDVDTSACNLPAHGRELLTGSEEFVERFPTFVSAVTATA